MKKTMKNQMNELRVYWSIWYGPPREDFIVPVLSLAEAKKILDTLADYSNILFDQKLVPDWESVGGVEEFVGGELTDEYDGWEEWEDEDGRGLHDLTFEEVLIADANRRRGT